MNKLRQSAVRTDPEARLRPCLCSRRVHATQRGCSRAPQHLRVMDPPVELLLAGRAGEQGGGRCRFRAALDKNCTERRNCCQRVETRLVSAAVLSGFSSSSRRAACPASAGSHSGLASSRAAGNVVGLKTLSSLNVVPLENLCFSIVQWVSNI